MRPFTTDPLLPGEPDWKQSEVRLRYSADGRLGALRYDGRLWLSHGVKWESSQLPVRGSVALPLFVPLPGGQILPIYDPLHGDILHWSLEHHRVVSEFSGSLFGIDIAVCGPDQRTAAFGVSNGNIQLVDLLTGETLAQMIGHRARVADFAFAPDGRTLASASWDGTVRLWNIATRQELFVLAVDSGRPFQSVAFSPDGRILLAVAGVNDTGVTVSVYDALSSE